MSNLTAPTVQPVPPYSFETGIKHGTLTICAEDGAYEVTTYRVDGEYEYNRRPKEVTFTASLREDLMRRDFTINAMAYSEGKRLVDFFDGQLDLRNRMVRCVGDPDERFREDGLRILRALRFASALDFSIDATTAYGVSRNRHLLQNISSERVQSELCKLLTGERPADILSAYRDVIAEIIPEFLESFDCAQNNPHHVYDVWQHTMAALKSSSNDLHVRLAVLFHDIGKPMTKSIDEKGIDHFYGHAKESARLTRKIMTRLRFDNETIGRVVKLVEIHGDDIDENSARVRRFMNRVGEECFLQFLDVCSADISGQAPGYRVERLKKIDQVRLVAFAIIESRQCFRLKDLAINGSDLVAAGMLPGPDIGVKLKDALELVIKHPELNTKDTLMGLLGMK